MAKVFSDSPRYLAASRRVSRPSGKIRTDTVSTPIVMMSPPLQSEKKRLPTLGFRPTPGVRRNIDDAAQKNGRSLSQEIESRLERSFHQEIAQRSTFGAGHIHGLAILVATAARLIEAETKRSWRDDRPTLDALKQAIEQILDVFGPAQIRGAETRDAFDTAVKHARDALGQILRP